MTRDEILAMPAGRELDVLVAEKVMGWKRRKPTHGSCCTCQTCGHCHDDCICEFWPSEDIADAWKVVEKMCEERKFAFGIYKTGFDTSEWEAEFGCKEEVCAETAPLAICRAALLAVMEDKDA